MGLVNDLATLDDGAYGVDAVVVGEVQEVRRGEYHQVGLLADFDGADAPAPRPRQQAAFKCRRGQGLFDR